MRGLKRRLRRLLRKVAQVRRQIRRAKQRPTDISENGVAFISEFEGFEPRPAPDPVGYCTVGFGHLIRYGACRPEDRKKFGTLTLKQGLDLLHSDLREYSDAIRDSVSVPLTQNQFDALVSFAYNNGVGAWLSSTLRRKINAKAPAWEIRSEFSKWVNAGTPPRPLPGLVRRRKAEADLFYQMP
jgi:lysozyme